MFFAVFSTAAFPTQQCARVSLCALQHRPSDALSKLEQPDTSAAQVLLRVIVSQDVDMAVAIRIEETVAHHDRRLSAGPPAAPSGSVSSSALLEHAA